MIIYKSMNVICVRNLIRCCVVLGEKKYVVNFEMK